MRIARLSVANLDGTGSAYLAYVEIPNDPGKRIWSYAIRGIALDTIHGKM